MLQHRTWYRKRLSALALAGALSLGLACVPATAFAEGTTDETQAPLAAVGESSANDQQTAPAADNTNQPAGESTENVSNTTAPAAEPSAVVDAAPAGDATTTDAPDTSTDVNAGAPAAASTTDDAGDATVTGAAPDAGATASGTPAQDENSAAADQSEEDAGEPEYNDPVEDGATFVIESGMAGNESQVLDAKGGKTTNGTNIQTYTHNNTVAQKYVFEKALRAIKSFFTDADGNETEQITGYEEDRDADGNIYYWIKAYGTEQVLTIAGDKNVKGTNVYLYAKNVDLDGQKWLLLDAGNGLFNIVSKLIASNGERLVLDIADGTKAKGANIQIWRKNNSVAQTFALLPGAASTTPKSNVEIENGGGVYTVKPKSNTGFATDVASGSKSNGANVRLWTSNNTAAQSLVITSDGKGYYTIGILHSAKVFDVANGSMVPGANVRQWTYNGSDAQKWSIQKNADGSYSFINKKSGLLLDIAGSAAKGTNLQVYRSKGEAATSQCFTLTRNTKADKNILGVGDAVDAKGIYTISPAANLGYVFDIKPAPGKTRQDADGLLQLWTSNGTQAQKFQIELVGDNEYLIRTGASGDYLTDKGSGAQVQQAAGNVWKAMWDQSGFYTFMNVATGRVLDVQNAKYAKGTIVQTIAGSNKVAQHFLITKANLVNPGYYYIKTNAGTTLDIAGGSTAAGANAQIWNYNKSDAQKYHIVKVGNYYQLVNVKSGKAIAGGGARDAQGYANVTQQTKSTTNKRQLWKIEVGNDGAIEFVNVASSENLFSRGQEKGDNVVEKDLQDKGYQSNINGRSWTLADAYGWIKQNGHWLYLSSDSRARFDKNVRENGKSTGNYDILHELWQKVQNNTSKTKYLIAHSWDSCYIGVFTGKKGNWAPLFGWNCANMSRDIVNEYHHGSAPTYSYLLALNNNKKYMLESDVDGWVWGLDTTWKGSRRRMINPAEQYFTSIEFWLGYHTYLSSKNELGKHLSHGCMRLDYPNAKWIYDNVGPGTRCLQLHTSIKV